MIEILWIIFILTPAILFCIKIGRKNRFPIILGIAAISLLFYSFLGYLFNTFNFRITILNITIVILIIDLILIYFLFTFKNKQNISFNLPDKYDILLILVVIFSFFIYSLDQSTHFSLLTYDSWYWFTGGNFVADNGYIDNKFIWYPDGFHFILGILMLPFKTSHAYLLVKYFCPLIACLTVYTIYEYSGKKIIGIISAIYLIFMPYLILRSSALLPETVGLFFIAIAALILKRYGLTKNSVIILGLLTGLSANIYHFTAAILFIVLSILILLKERKLFIYFLFLTLAASIFFWFPYVSDTSGVGTYAQAITTKYSEKPYLISDMIYGSGIVLGGTKGVAGSVIGFPLAILFPLLLLQKKKLDDGTLFSLILLLFSVVMGLSYLLQTNSFALRYQTSFSLSCALLFGEFVLFLKWISGMRIQKFETEKIKKILLITIIILILVNRILLIGIVGIPAWSGGEGIHKYDYPDNHAKMVLWIDENIDKNSEISILPGVVKELQGSMLYGVNASAGSHSHPRFNDIVYPIKVYHTKSGTEYILCNSLYDESPINYVTIHEEGELVLSKRNI